MLGITILESHWCLGMNATIEFRVNSGKQYRVMFAMHDGLAIAEMDSYGDYGKSKKIEAYDIIRYLPNRFGWTPEIFMFAWEASAQGFERGRMNPDLTRCKT